MRKRSENAPPLAVAEARVIFIRSYIGKYDGKLQKYLSAARQLKVPSHFVGWNRGGAGGTQELNATFYHGSGSLGAGFRNVWHLLFWNLFILRWLFSHRKSIAVVHAIDLDTAISAWIFTRAFGKKLVFDVYDKYSAVRQISGILGKSIDSVENLLIKHAELSILADQSRYAQHGLPPDLPNTIILENVPQTSPPSNHPGDSKYLSLGYFGVLEAKHRGLEDLLAVCSNRPDVSLHIVGYGPLEASCKLAAITTKNIHFHGPLSPTEGLKVMAGTNIIVGLYYKSVPNHLYAAPNKYYEHLLLGKAMLTTRGTPPGEKVESNHTGWAIDEGVSAIEKWICDITPEMMLAAGTAARRLWEELYENYYATHYEGLYGDRLVRLAGQFTSTCP